MRQQKVVLSGYTSSRQNVTAGVVQGSVLRLLLFLIYINDFSDEIASMVNELFNGKYFEPDPIKQDIEACF